MMNTDNWEIDFQTEWAGQKHFFQQELESTNVTAGQLAAAGAVHGTVVTADKQTGGRGRRGRTWESPAGKNIYFSLVLRPDFEPEKASMLTLLMAHSVAEAIEDITRAGTAAGIKWPNDILIHGKKVCGILTEMRVEKGKIQHVIIGVGINVKLQNFTGELVEKASSLEDTCGKTVDRPILLKKILKIFEKDYRLFEKAGNLTPFIQTYQSRLLNMDAQVKVLDPKEAFEGIARGISETGELLVEKTDGSMCRVYAGEVSVRGLQGYI